MSWVYLNGKLLPEEEAYVPLKDSGFLFGEGEFTTMRVFDGCIYFYEQHMERLGFSLDLTPLLMKNGAERGLWRLKVIKTSMTLAAYLWPFEEIAGPLSLSIFKDPVQGPLSHVKSLAYQPRFELLKWAQFQGRDDCLTVSAEGFLLESSRANFFAFDGKTLFVPHGKLPYLRGIALKELVKRFPTEEVFWTSVPEHMSVFLCNALRGIIPVGQIDNTRYTLRDLGVNLWEETCGHFYLPSYCPTSS